MIWMRSLSTAVRLVMIRVSEGRFLSIIATSRQDQRNFAGGKMHERDMWGLQGEIASGMLAKLKALPPSPKTHAVRCICDIQVRAMGSVNTLLVLYDYAPHNYVHDGAVILRGLYDLHLQALYLMQQPDERSRLFTDYRDVQAYRLLQAARRNESDIGKEMRTMPFEPQFAQVQAKYEAVRSKFPVMKFKGGRWSVCGGNGCRKYWYPGSLADLAREVGFLAEYGLMQPNLSNSVHSTPFGLIHGPGVNKGMLLNYAWQLNFRILAGIVRYAGIELDEFERWATTFCQHSLCDYHPTPPPEPCETAAQE